MTARDDPAALQAAITAAEDQMCAGFADQLRLDEEIRAVCSRIEELLADLGAGVPPDVRRFRRGNP
jgi:hypothetical protein